MSPPQHASRPVAPPLERLACCVPYGFLAASVLFLLAACLRVGGAPSSRAREAGNIVRIPAAAVLLAAAAVHVATDWLAAAAVAHRRAAHVPTPRAPHPPPPPRSPLDWPAAYSALSTGAFFLTGALGVASGTTVGVRLGAIAWLVGSLLSATQAALLLAIDTSRGSGGGCGGGRAPACDAPVLPPPPLAPPPLPPPPRRALGARLRRSLAQPPVAISTGFLIGSACFVGGSLLYLVRPAAPFVLEAELCFVVGACLFVAGTAAATGFCGVRAELVGVLHRHRTHHHHHHAQAHHDHDSDTPLQPLGGGGRGASPPLPPGAALGGEAAAMELTPAAVGCGEAAGGRPTADMPPLPLARELQGLD